MYVTEDTEEDRYLFIGCKFLESKKDEINLCIDRDLVYNNRGIHQYQKEGVYLLQSYFVNG